MGKDFYWNSLHNVELEDSKQHSPGHFFKVLIKNIQQDDVFDLAAQLAYYFLLSIFPLLIFVMTLLPYLPITKEDLLGIVEGFAPGDIMNTIESNIDQVLNRNVSLLSFGIIATI